MSNYAARVSRIRDELSSLSDTVRYDKTINNDDAVAAFIGHLDEMRGELSVKLLWAAKQLDGDNGTYSIV